MLTIKEKNIKKKVLLFWVELSIFSSLLQAQERLKDYAGQIGLNIGVAIKERYITSDNKIHNELVKNEFNTIVCENQMKAAMISPYSKNTFNFSTADQVVDSAINNGMKIRGHTLVWHNQNSSWLKQGPADTLLANMKYYIQNVMNHFKGKVYQWDVVNEAFSDSAGGGFRKSTWYNIIGEDYIDSAFVYAHRVDPECKLYINDYGTSFVCDKSNSLYNKVKKMLENGIPIHGVGFQCHEGADLRHEPELYNKLKSNFDRFVALGLEIAITEMDVKVYPDITTLEDQAIVFGTFLRAALATKNCNTFMVWGVSDKDSWLDTAEKPLLFDNDFKPKPAYDTLLSILRDLSKKQNVVIPVLKTGDRNNKNDISAKVIFNLRGCIINPSLNHLTRSNGFYITRGKYNHRGIIILKQSLY